MNDFFKSFGIYCKEAHLASLWFWFFPVITLVFIWVMTTVGLKIFTRRKALKTIFVANRAWIVSSMIAAGILISLICFWWSKNYFAHNPLQLSLLISLAFAMLIPILALLNLRRYYTQEQIKDITDQPKTLNQLDVTVAMLKRAYRNSKLYFVIPLVGFLFLLFYLNKGVNLIALVYDNSASMIKTNASDALSETFDNLQENNEIVLTTVDGLSSPDDPAGKATMKDIMSVQKPAALKGGNVVSFNNPSEAKNGLLQISNTCYGSPICESIWKTFLFIRDTKGSQSYRNKVLIVITDGQDNIDATLHSNKFFFDNEDFAQYFPAENVFIIDYSAGGSSAFMQRFQGAGCDIYPAENNKQAYLDALDNALESFKNNWFLVYWTITIFLVFLIAGLLIQPRKIA